MSDWDDEEQLEAEGFFDEDTSEADAREEFVEMLGYIESWAEDIDDFLIIDLGDGDFLVRVDVDGEWHDIDLEWMDLDVLYDALNVLDIDYAYYTDN